MKNAVQNMKVKMPINWKKWAKLNVDELQDEIKHFKE